MPGMLDMKEHSMEERNGEIESPEGSAKLRGILVALIAFVAIAAGISLYSDVETVWGRLHHFAFSALAAALGLSLINYLFRFLRWQKYLRRCEISVPTRQSVGVFLAGFSMSVSPGKMGELIKSLLLHRLQGVSIARSSPIVVAERVTDLLALLFLGIAGVFAYGQAQGLVLVAAALVAMALLLVSWPQGARKCIELATSPSLVRRFRDGLLRFYEGLAALLGLRAMVPAISLAAMGWLCEGIGFWLILRGFPGAEVPIALAIFIYAATTIAGALSFLPGGLLVTEATMTLLLVSSDVGVDEATALAATVLIRLATLWFAVGIGILALLWVRKGRGSETDATPG